MSDNIEHAYACTDMANLLRKCAQEMDNADKKMLDNGYEILIPGMTPLIGPMKS